MSNDWRSGTSRPRAAGDYAYWNPTEQPSQAKRHSRTFTPNLGDPATTSNVLKFMPPGHFCPDVCGIEDFGPADSMRGRVVRAFFKAMRLWPKAEHRS